MFYVKETHLKTSMTSYGDSFTYLYVDNARTPQETPMGLHGLLLGWLYFFMYT
jgi:hypothetical protein